MAKKNLSCLVVNKLRKLVDSGHAELCISRQCACWDYPDRRMKNTYVGIDVAHHGKDRHSHLEDLCSGIRRLMEDLAGEGITPSRDRVQNLIRRHGFKCNYPPKKTTVPSEPSERFPCLFDFKQVRTADQIWATEITTIPLQEGFLYAVAIVDLFSRNVISWMLLLPLVSVSLFSFDTEYLRDALEKALAIGRKQQIFHSDQGCQFTSWARLQAENVKISWSGRMVCYDNILVERL